MIGSELLIEERYEQRLAAFDELRSSWTIIISYIHYLSVILG